MLVPGQTSFTLGEIETEGTSIGFTTIVVSVLVAAAGEAQAALEVITTETLSPFANEVDE
jgi:hypothetical protein